MDLKPERLDEFHAGKVGFPSVRINADTVIDLFPIEGGRSKQNDTEKTAGNLNHFCMVIGKEDFSGIIDHLKENRIISEKDRFRAGALAAERHRFTFLIPMATR